MSPDRQTRVQTRFIEANGLRFETDVAGEGDRFALLLHGFPENKYSWRFQIPMLAEAGCTVWAPNLRGYGRSSRPPARSAYGLEHLTADVVALLAAAGRERPYRERVLIGHDWGAAIAWAAAMEKPAPIDRLVILNVPHPALMRRGLGTARQLLKSWYIGFFQLPLLPELALGARGADAVGRAFADTVRDRRNFTDADLAVYRAAAAAPGALTAMLNYYRANIANPLMRAVSSESAPRIEIPTLVIWGEADHALGKELTVGTDRFVSDLTLRRLPGVSHWVQQEAPETVNAMLAAFLAGDPVPDASTVRTDIEA